MSERFRVGAVTLLELDKWSFVVGTWDGNVMKIYVNGELKNSRTDVLSGSIDYCPGAAATLVGMGENGIEPFSGNIDDMAFYNRALSQAEITQLYAGKKPSVAQFIATVNNLTVNVDASSSIGNIQSYEWTSSDGQTKSGKTATFAFSKAGTYTITLTTRDDKGVVSQAAKTVQIQNSVPSLMVLTVSKQGTGTVSGTGINCGTDCTESLAANTTVTLTATPAANFTFAGWDGCTSSNNVCQITLNADKSVTAKFIQTTPPSQYLLSVNKQGEGLVSGTGIDCGTDCTESLAANTTVTLTATPAANFTFAGWDGCTSSNNVCQITLNAAKSVTAKFMGDKPEPPECAPLHAIYTDEDKTLRIPLFEIPMIALVGGTPTNRVESYSATFKLLYDSQHFLLKNVAAPTVEKVNGCAVASYNPETGMLSLPYVDIPIMAKLGNTKIETKRSIYQASLHWMPMLGNNIFVVESTKQLQ